jgi:hypothetical protein
MPKIAGKSLRKPKITVQNPKIHHKSLKNTTKTEVPFWRAKSVRPIHSPRMSRMRPLGVKTATEAPGISAADSSIACLVSTNIRSR